MQNQPSSAYGYAIQIILFYNDTFIVIWSKKIMIWNEIELEQHFMVESFVCVIWRHPKHTKLSIVNGIWNHPSSDSNDFLPYLYIIINKKGLVPD